MTEAYSLALYTDMECTSRRIVECTAYGSIPPNSVVVWRMPTSRALGYLYISLLLVCRYRKATKRTQLIIYFYFLAFPAKILQSMPQLRRFYSNHLRIMQEISLVAVCDIDSIKRRLLDIPAAVKYPFYISIHQLM